MVRGVQRIIQTLALAGAFLTLCTGIWQGWAFVVAVKKVFLAYLGVFFIGAAMVLAMRLAGSEQKPREDKVGAASRAQGDLP